MKRSRLKPGKGLVRRTALRAKSWWNRSTPLKKINRERKAKEFERAYGGKERVEWGKAQPSVLTGQSPCVNAHVPPKGDNSGMGRKADACWLVPLTWAEHEYLHHVGRETFEREFMIDLAREARRVEARWRAER